MAIIEKFYEKDKIGNDPRKYYESLFDAIPSYRMSQAKMFAWAMENQFFCGTRGHFLEFGTYAGESLALAYHAYMIYMKRKVREIAPAVRKPPRLFDTRFYSFDSFKGLPESENNKGHEQFDLQPGCWSCSLEECKENLKNMGVDMNRVHLIDGWYHETLGKGIQDKIKAAALVHIDCDHYESAILALDFITPILVDGAVIMFDDWMNYRGREDYGEQKAFNEWLSKNKSRFRARQWIPYTSNAMSFFINKIKGKQ